MAPYVPQNLGLLRLDIANDLRDPTYKTYSQSQITDLINEGMAEVNRLRPLERIEELTLIAGGTGYATTLRQIFLVEGKRSGDTTWWPIPEQDYGAGVGNQGGWTLFAGTLILPGLMTPLDPVNDDIRAWGYRDRDPVKVDTDVPNFIDMSDEEAVRCYARWMALEMLLHDRALYQQWQTQANNSDVSTTQLLQSASSYQREWDTLRKRLVRLRRVA